MSKLFLENSLDPAPVDADIRPVTLAAGGKLVVKSQTGTGRLLTPLRLNGGELYIGQSVTGDKIGSVTATGKTEKLYRLLITNLPATIPTESYEFTYQTMGSTPQVITEGSFMVRDGIACLWLNKAVAGQLLFTVGSSTIRTDNVTINPNHFNTETYGVSEVAQIMNGKKYTDLADALNNAAGKTITLLKNAALKRSVSVNGSVVLKMDGYSITAQSESGGSNATLSVDAVAGNLQITGKGSITADFRIGASAITHSNGNLQIDEGVILNSTVMMDGQPMQRTSVKGLPVATREVHYSYGRSADNPDLEQQGDVIASEGTLCLWLSKRFTTPQNLFVDVKADGLTYLATSVVIEGHTNPVMVMMVGAVAGIGNETYDTLAKAFEAADGTEAILLRKNTSLSDVLNLPDAVTATVTLNLDKKNITASNAGFNANKGRIVLTDGSLTGTLSLTDNVYAGGDVMMNNATVSKDNKTVWRTLLTLPVGITSFTYKIGNDAAIPAITSTNIQVVDGKPVACLWLPSSGVVQSLTVEAGGKVYALSNIIVASTHGNELDAINNNPVAVIGLKEYASLAAALASAADNETILLKKEVSLSSVQTVSKNLTLDLGGWSITSGYSGFDVIENCKLTLTRGQLLGTVRLPGKGQVYAGKDVKIAGIILNGEADEVFRTLVKVGTAPNAPTECLWIEPTDIEHDRTITTTEGASYEVSLPAGLSNHNTILTAYQQTKLDGAGQWDATYSNTNLVLTSGAVLDISVAPEGAILHRLTLHDGAWVVTTDALGKPTSGQVLATDGIRYIRAFALNEVWESVALPYTAARIQAEVEDPVSKEMSTILLIPASGTGTAGDFWLKTMGTGGDLQNVNSTEMTANVSYLMAVPAELKEKKITFVSGSGQYLRRDKVMAVKPVSGFASYANGTLNELSVNEYCYVLDIRKQSFERMETVNIKPFRGYLLADAATTTITPSLRVGVSTGIEPINPEGLRISTRRGCIVLESVRPIQVQIHTMTGWRVHSFRMAEGSRQVFLPAGIYIVNRQKVIVATN